MPEASTGAGNHDSRWIRPREPLQMVPKLELEFEPPELARLLDGNCSMTTNCSTS